MNKEQIRTIKNKKVNQKYSWINKVKQFIPFSLFEIQTFMWRRESEREKERGAVLQDVCCCVAYASQGPAKEDQDSQGVRAPSPEVQWSREQSREQKA
jgi:hypothetical protein